MKLHFQSLSLKELSMVSVFVERGIQILVLTFQFELYLHPHQYITQFHHHFLQYNAETIAYYRSFSMLIQHITMHITILRCNVG